jgi:hypothetical protein
VELLYIKIEEMRKVSEADDSLVKHVILHELY